jgi:hypothetical protein
MIDFELAGYDLTGGLLVPTEGGTPFPEGQPRSDHLGGHSFAGHLSGQGD